MINTNYRPCTDVLMESLAAVEKAQKVVILMEREDALSIRTNCSYRELKWVLDQATFAIMKELFED